MSLTKVKICGLTTPADAALAVSLGAEFLGVIFAGSPRRVNLERAARIRAAAPTARMVGVFCDPSLQELAIATNAVGLDFLQLHGQESPGFCREAHLRTGLPVIKAFVGDPAHYRHHLASFDTAYFLFDSHKDVSKGTEQHPLPEGRVEYPTPEEFDPRQAHITSLGCLGSRVFLAGGLTTRNVRRAVAATRPFAVDVCRGVESEPGVKDPRALQRFIAEVHA